MTQERLELILRAGPPEEPRYEPVLTLERAHTAAEIGRVAVAPRARPIRPFAATQIVIAIALVLAMLAAAMLAGSVRRNQQLVPPSMALGPSPTPAATPSPSPSRRTPTSDIARAGHDWALDAGIGSAIGVVLDGQIYLGGDKIPPDLAVLRLGAVSRLFLVTMMLQLVDEGQLSLDDRLTRFVAGWPAGDEITVRMLLSGSSGVAAFGAPLEDLQSLIADEPTRVWDADDGLAIARAGERRFEPGARISPADTEDTLLAEIIEKVTGATSSTEIQRRLLAPASLRAVFVAGQPVPPPGAGSQPGSRDPRKLVEMWRGNVPGSAPGSLELVDDVDPALLAAIGPRGMASTALDLGRFSDTLRNTDELLSGDGRNLVGLPYEEGGFGGAAMCPCRDGSPRSVVIHGSTGAYSSLIAWIPDKRLTIAILNDREVALDVMLDGLEWIDALVPE